MQRRALVCGAGGFIGYHLVTRLKQEGYWVRGVDVREPLFGITQADEFFISDLREQARCRDVIDHRFDEVYQLAANFGGEQFVLAGKYDAAILHDSMLINLNVLEVCRQTGSSHVFFPSFVANFVAEDDAGGTCRLPVFDSETSWEKRFAERLYQSYHRVYGMHTCVARLPYVFGEHSPWQGERAGLVATLCRLIAEAPAGGEIHLQLERDRPLALLYIAECIDGIRALMASDQRTPVDFYSGSNLCLEQLMDVLLSEAGKPLTVIYAREGGGGHLEQTIACQKAPLSESFRQSLARTYRWVAAQVTGEMPAEVPAQRIAV